ncbi:MAG: hypothetical protein WBA68_10160 [Alteraurantiacibacter sp.]
MSGPRISDHALVRFLERAGGFDFEPIRDALAASLKRSHTAAISIGSENHVIKVDGLLYAIRGGVLVTVLEERNKSDAARAVQYGHERK